ncbi:hypothetical protein [Nocardia yamanashiensis]|uniref:hypothetical protein n=1 Tax=Nocardia yamanashiensis TaxID=209247 RepID=UPI00147130F4|nr:hypothetical protein [Nocardia yamanashiensis]
MISGTFSRISHREIAASNIQLRYERGVRELLDRHRHCIAGQGHIRQSCSARRQLVLIARQRKWPLSARYNDE